jgi:hypothetical protein
MKPDAPSSAPPRVHKSKIVDDADTSDTDDTDRTPPPAAQSNDDPNVGDSGGAVAAVDPSSSRKSEIRRLILQKKLDIRACYTHAFGVDKVKGQVIFEWQYNERGKVIKTTMISSDFTRPRFEKCIERIIQSITFPKSSSEVVSKVRYPFQFD